MELSLLILLSLFILSSSTGRGTMMM